MRAREFIREQRELPPESKEPLRYTYTLPGLGSSDPYKLLLLGLLRMQLDIQQQTKQRG